MKKTTLIVLGIAILGILAWLVPKPAQEPVYEGKRLSYWMAHWYRGASGPKLLVDPSAQAAVQQAGTNALPFLIKWMGMRFTDAANYPSWSLQGFEVLGATGKAAVPDLIALLGKHSNCSSWALARIGVSSIPALTNMLNEAASAAEEQRSRPSGMVCFFIAFVLRVVC